MTTKEFKELEKIFVNELETRKFGFDYLGYLGVLKLIYWKMFKRRRMIYFMHMIISGYATAIAYKYAQEQSNEYIKEYLKIHNI